MTRLIWTAAALIATVSLIVISQAPPWDADVEAGGHSATRAFAAPWVAPGGEMEVTITAGGYGALGRVIETLPEGFGYARSTLPASAVKVEGDTLKFTLLGEERFAYTVRAPAVEGQYSFSGALLDANAVREEAGGDTLLRVGSEPTATPTPGPAATSTATPTPEPTATPAPLPIPTPVTTGGTSGGAPGALWVIGALFGLGRCS